MRRIILAVTVSLVIVAMMASASLAATAPAAPVISNPSEGSLVNSFFTLSGTAPTNSIVKVFEVLDSGYTVDRGYAEVLATGKWELRLTGVADGKHAYKAYATDKATGQNSGWSNTRTVTVKALAAPVIEHPGGEVCTRDGSFALGGIAKPNTTVRAADVSPTGQISMVGTATVSPYVGRVETLVQNGRWSMNLSGVSEGTHRYMAQTIEKTGTYTINSAWSIPQTVNVTHQELPEWFELQYQDPNAPQDVQAHIERENAQMKLRLRDWSTSTGVEIECMPQPHKHGSTIYYY